MVASSMLLANTDEWKNQSDSHTHLIWYSRMSAQLHTETFSRDDIDRNMAVHVSLVRLNEKFTFFMHSYLDCAGCRDAGCLPHLGFQSWNSSLKKKECVRAPAFSSSGVKPNAAGRRGVFNYVSAWQYSYAFGNAFAFPPYVSSCEPPCKSAGRKGHSLDYQQFINTWESAVSAVSLFFLNQHTSKKCIRAEDSVALVQMWFFFYLFYFDWRALGLLCIKQFQRLHRLLDHIMSSCLEPVFGALPP